MYKIHIHIPFNHQRLTTEKWKLIFKTSLLILCYSPFHKLAFIFLHSVHVSMTITPKTQNSNVTSQLKRIKKRFSPKILVKVGEKVTV